MSVSTAEAGVLISGPDSQTPDSQTTGSQIQEDQPAASASASPATDSTLTAEACNVSGLSVYVDVDETLLRHYGTRQIPIPSVIKQVKALYKQGAELYCWSSMGAAYARQCAETCGVAHCFQAFLPKPQIIVDDQQPKAWRKILHVHPSQCSSQTTVEEYREELKKPRSL
jgi:hypothetical protein